MHELVIQCPPRSMTDKIEISINELAMDQRITVGDITLPEGATTDVDSETVIVQCVEKQAVPDEVEEVPAVTGAEPEVIGEKKDDEGGDNS